MERHSTNAVALAHWLETHPSVAWVSHLSFPKHKSHALATKYFARAGFYGSMLNFGIKGGQAAAAKFTDALKLASHLVGRMMKFLRGPRWVHVACVVSILFSPSSIHV